MATAKPMTPEQKVVHNLSKLIDQTLRAHASESQRPRRGPDQMDYFLGETGKRVVLLRRLREEFEDEMARDTDLDPR